MCVLIGNFVVVVVVRSILYSHIGEFLSPVFGLNLLNLWRREKKTHCVLHKPIVHFTAWTVHFLDLEYIHNFSLFNSYLSMFKWPIFQSFSLCFFVSLSFFLYTNICKCSLQLYRQRNAFEASSFVHTWPRRNQLDLLLVVDHIVHLYNQCVCVCVFYYISLNTQKSVYFANIWSCFDVLVDAGLIIHSKWKSASEQAWNKQKKKSNRFQYNLYV